MKRVEELREEVQKLMGDEFIVEAREVKKNNGVVLEGLSIRTEGQNVFPTIYIDENITAEIIVDMYKNQRDESIANMNFKEKVNKEYILENVFPVLYNCEKNKERLEELVHTTYEDLVIFYRVGLSDESATFLVSKDNIKAFGITEQEIHNSAMRNVKGKGKIVKFGFMNIVTFKDGWYGAGAIFDEEILKKIHEEMGDEIIVIPASIHELLIVSESDDVSIEAIREMIRQVNEEAVEEEDFLSDNAYFLKNNMLKVA